MKITRFQDIPEFIRHGSYEVDLDLERLIPNIDDLVASQGLDIDPDFQRDHVWTEKQQVAYLEFFLRGGKTGRVIYLNSPSWHNPVKKGEYNDFVLVDGKQRLNAVRRFFNNEIRVFESRRSEYTDKPRMIMNTFKMNINSLKTRAEVLQWYLDFNSGGTVHSDDELDKVRAMILKEAKKRTRR